MENNNEKRMAGCWEILHALHIGDKEVVVGENLTEPNEARYMCAYCTANDIMRGYNEYMASCESRNRRTATARHDYYRRAMP